MKDNFKIDYYYFSSSKEDGQREMPVIENRFVAHRYEEKGSLCVGDHWRQQKGQLEVGEAGTVGKSLFCIFHKKE